MRYSGSTVVDFLWACAALTAACGATTSLVSAKQPGGQSKRTASLAKAMLLYAEDYDDHFPLAMSRRPNGTYRWSVPHPAPADAVTNSGWGDAQAISSSASFWANAVRPLVSDPASYRDPTQLVKPMPGDQFRTGVKPLDAGLTMNGLLNAYPRSQIPNPGLVPLVWAGTGSVALHGRAHTNPMLFCDGQADGCRFNAKGPHQLDSSTVNGAAGVMWFLSNSFPDLTIWSKSTGKSSGGGTIARVDGSARYVSWGTALAPKKTRDATTDPYMRVTIKSGKVEGFEYWGSDSPDCSDVSDERDKAQNSYPCFFRPDRVK